MEEALSRRLYRTTHVNSAAFADVLCVGRLPLPIYIDLLFGEGVGMAAMTVGRPMEAVFGGLLRCLERQVVAKDPPAAPQCVAVSAAVVCLATFGRLADGDAEVLRGLAEAGGALAELATAVLPFAVAPYPPHMHADSGTLWPVAFTFARRMFAAGFVDAPKVHSVFARAMRGLLAGVHATCGGATSRLEYLPALVTTARDHAEFVRSSGASPAVFASTRTALWRIWAHWQGVDATGSKGPLPVKALRLLTLTPIHVPLCDTYITLTQHLCDALVNAGHVADARQAWQDTHQWVLVAGAMVSQGAVEALVRVCTLWLEFESRAGQSLDSEDVPRGYLYEIEAARRSGSGNALWHYVWDPPPSTAGQVLAPAIDSDDEHSAEEAAEEAPPPDPAVLPLPFPAAIPGVPTVDAVPALEGSSALRHARVLRSPMAWGSARARELLSPGPKPPPAATAGPKPPPATTAGRKPTPSAPKPRKAPKAADAPRPNYFLGVRLGVRAEQVTAATSEVVAAAPKLEPCVLSPVKTHLTLGVVALASPAAIERAKAVLDSVAGELVAAAGPSGLALTMRGLGCFSGSVLYIKAEEDAAMGRLRRMAAIVQVAYAEAGLLGDFRALAKACGGGVRPAAAWEALRGRPREDVLVAVGNAWEPHATIMKHSKARRAKGLPRITDAMFSGHKDTDFGACGIAKAELLSMQDMASDGFYRSLRVAVLPTAVSDSGSSSDDEWPETPEAAVVSQQPRRTPAPPAPPVTPPLGTPAVASPPPGAATPVASRNPAPTATPVPYGGDRTDANGGVRSGGLKAQRKAAPTPAPAAKPTPKASPGRGGKEASNGTAKAGQGKAAPAPAPAAKASPATGTPSPGKGGPKVQGKAAPTPPPAPKSAPKPSKSTPPSGKAAAPTTGSSNSTPRGPPPAPAVVASPPPAGAASTPSSGSKSARRRKNKKARNAAAGSPPGGKVSTGLVTWNVPVRGLAAPAPAPTPAPAPAPTPAPAPAPVAAPVVTSADVAPLPQRQRRRRGKA